MLDYQETLINFSRNSLRGTVAVLEAKGNRFTHIALAGCLPSDYGEQVDLYTALIENVLCDCVIIDISEIALSDQGSFPVLAFLLNLVLFASSDVAFVAGGRRENGRFLESHFHRTGPIHGSVIDAVRSYKMAA